MTALQRPAQRHGPRRASTVWGPVFFLLLPFLAVYLLFFVWPALQTLWLSFTTSGLTETGPWTGLSNFRTLIGDASFWSALGHTVFFAVLTVIPLTAIGMLMAILTRSGGRLRRVAQAVFFIPYVLPVSVATLIWQWVLNPNLGVVNAATGSQIAWFSDPTLAMPAVAAVTVWWTIGFNMLLFLAGLQNIPQETYEAAALDGAQGGQVFRYITWPALWPTTALVLTLQLVGSFKIFSQVYLLTGGGPFDSTRVVLEYMYDTAFTNTDAGYASAIAVAFFVVILLLTLLQNTLLNRGRA
ncbi:sugar ABC transporter permease [Deinococcus sonorensis]|uniref:Sugar ABC transporter permease n=2 Tax=Deinococcus sonorensis TaxID=309891 RepID=A0AAU7UDN7_9DEIO